VSQRGSTLDLREGLTVLVVECSPRVIGVGEIETFVF